MNRLEVQSGPGIQSLDSAFEVFRKEIERDLLDPVDCLIDIEVLGEHIELVQQVSPGNPINEIVEGIPQPLAFFSHAGMRGLVDEKIHQHGMVRDDAANGVSKTRDCEGIRRKAQSIPWDVRKCEKVVSLVDQPSIPTCENLSILGDPVVSRIDQLPIQSLMVGLPQRQEHVD
jgi:hypothetical protein